MRWMPTNATLAIVCCHTVSTIATMATTIPLIAIYAFTYIIERMKGDIKESYSHDRYRCGTHLLTYLPSSLSLRLR